MPWHRSSTWRPGISDSDPVASLLLAATRLTPGRAPDVRQVDWDLVIGNAEYHAVTPLLTRWLAARPEGVPAGVLAALRARYDANALRNVVLTQRLAELLDLLAARGVEAMPIKGPALAISAYGDLALREFGDLDIVVRPAHFDRARELLDRCGYRPLTQLSAAGERALRASDHHLPLVHQETKVMVELHWSLDNGRPGRVLDGEWVWTNARRVSLLGREVPAFSWSALLVYLSVHGAKHCFGRLGWIRDVAGVLAAAPAGELSAAPDLAAAADARRRLALGVALARGMLDAPVRDDLRVSDIAEVAALERKVLAILFGGEEPTLPRWLGIQLRSFDRARDGAGYLWHIIAAPHVADVEALALPDGMRGIYAGMRPLRLLAKYGRRVLRGGKGRMSS